MLGEIQPARFGDEAKAVASLPHGCVHIVRLGPHLRFEKAPAWTEKDLPGCSFAVKEQCAQRSPAQLQLCLARCAMYWDVLSTTKPSQAAPLRTWDPGSSNCSEVSAPGVSYFSSRILEAKRCKKMQKLHRHRPQTAPIHASKKVMCNSNLTYVFICYLPSFMAHFEIHWSEMKSKKKTQEAWVETETMQSWRNKTVFLTKWKEGRRRDINTGTRAGTRRNQEIKMEQNPPPDKRKRGDKHRNQNRNQKEPGNHDGTQPRFLKKKKR